MRRRPSVTQTWMTIAYVGAAMAIAVLVLPSALRPPPQAPPSAAQLSPDTPPDDQVLISELARGTSGTAGAQVPGAAGPDGSGEGLPAVDVKPRKGRCYGDPARQFESIYAPPCAPAFTGTNAGATYQGVTANEVRVALVMDGSYVPDPGYEGPVSESPRQLENAASRTYRHLQAYFNERLELYGRKLRWYFVQSAGNHPARRAAALRAADQHKVFIAHVGAYWPAVDELSRRKVPSFNHMRATRSFLVPLQPYAWSATADSTIHNELGAEYICKKLAGRPPRYNERMDPSSDYSKPRIFGILSYQDGKGYDQNVPGMRRMLQEGCGQEVKEAVEYGLYGDASNEQVAAISTAITRMRAAGVTTVISLQDWFTNPAFLQQADEQGWFPEWFVPGSLGLDRAGGFDPNFQNYSATQWRHAFGFSLVELPTSRDDSECFRAYRTMDPNNNPDETVCYYMWEQLVPLHAGLQLAGPALTPETLRAGLYKYCHKPDPIWRIAGCFGPNEPTYAKYAAEMWYDPSAPYPTNSRPGAYRFINGGKRFTRGEITEGESPGLFKDPGITRVPRNA